MLKHTHLTLVGLSITLFLLRALCMYAWPGALKARWLKVTPHVIDTLLLLSAIGLMLTISQYPLTHHWLTAKILGLVAYIGFGTVALKRGRNLRTRSLALLGALASVGYMLGVAITRSPTLGIF
ncbi:SirB2 family protein [Marinobacterium alkalitolerans]|nr:SirB2 family protein [Marinobacterium alkalitolerans]